MRSSGEKGFTLVEVLIAMTLMSVVVLILTLATRLALDAWQRSSREETTVPLTLAIPTTLDRQLLSLVSEASFTQGGGGVRLPFCGEAHGISFFTVYAPRGSRAKGLLRVTYSFDEDAKTLFLYQQVVTRQDQMDDRYLPLSDHWDGEMEPVSEISGIESLEFRFADEQPVDIRNSENWESRWSCGSNTRLPSGLRLQLRLGGNGQKLQTWYFLTRASDL